MSEPSRDCWTVKKELLEEYEVYWWVYHKAQDMYWLCKASNLYNDRKAVARVESFPGRYGEISSLYLVKEKRYIDFESAEEAKDHAFYYFGGEDGRV